MDKYVWTVLTIVAIGVIGLNIQIFNSSKYLTFTVPKWQVVSKNDRNEYVLVSNWGRTSCNIIYAESSGLNEVRPWHGSEFQEC